MGPFSVWLPSVHVPILRFPLVLACSLLPRELCRRVAHPPFILLMGVGGVVSRVWLLREAATNVHAQFSAWWVLPLLLGEDLRGWEMGGCLT